MTGRGRGRGALARWEAANTRGESTSRVGSSVFAISKAENWEAHEVKKTPGNSARSGTLARVTNIIDVGHFWAQTGSDDQLKQFDTYMAALNSWCNEQQMSSVQQVPVCGQSVCVRHTDTGQWRRAQVTRLSDSMVDVFYLDYGQPECVTLDRLCKSTPGDIASRPALARYITLEGVKPVGERWSEEANNRFSELVSSKLTIHFSDNFRGKLYLRNSSGQDVSVGDMLISEGFAQSSDSDVGRPWTQENTRTLNSEQQKRIYQQWNSLMFQPSESQQPSPKTNDHFSAERNTLTSSPFPKEPLNSNAITCRKMFSPPQMYDNESTKDMSGISLNDIPLPPKPDFLMQNKESDKLETFNIKRADPDPVQSLRSGRPHLASPSEFFSQSRPGQDSGGLNANSTFSKTESSPKYKPPHVRNTQAMMNETAAMNAEPKLENFTSAPKGNVPQHKQWSPFSNFSFSPKQGRKNIAAQFQSNAVNLGDVPPDAQQQHNVQPWQKPEFLKTQPLNENTKDKTLKAELEWKIWKLQRKVKKVIDRMAIDDAGNYSHELDQIIADSRLSQEFQGISEVSIVLKLLLDKVLEKSKFSSVAVRVCTIFRDLGIFELSDLINKVITECQGELMEQCCATDSHQRCHRFSSFLGKLYLEVLNETDSTGLKSSVDGIVAHSLHNWLSFDQDDSVEIHVLNSVCLTGFFKVTGPTIDQTEGNEISRYFATIRDLVLSQDLALPVKSTLLDILLLRASGWKVEDNTDEQETGSLSTEDEVFVEAEDDVTEEQPQEETGDQDDSEEWDPYRKVKSMLKNLKLQDLLPKFFDNCIRDSLLTADWEELKRTLQEAGFPPGVILEIRMYLDKGLLEKDVQKRSEPTTVKNTASSATITQELKRASKSPSPTKAMEHGIEINQLNQELQQLMIGGNQDKGGQTKKISPQKELAGHEGTPYSRGGFRKFVSRAERRRSTDSPQEEVTHPMTDQACDLSEKRPRSSPPPVESVNSRTSVETSPEDKTATSMSYSAVLKSASQDAPKNGPASAKPNPSKTFSRPPPGFAPLPTHGGDTKMTMTVLGNKTKTKPPGLPSNTPRNTSTQTSSTPWNTPVQPGSTPRNTPTQSSSTPRNTPSRADSSTNWRNDCREEQFSQGFGRPGNSSQPGHARNRRRFDNTMGQSKSPPRSGGFNEATGRETPVGAMSPPNNEESPEPPPVVHAHRAFGPGGLKACVICGSKDHLRCNDRRKMFMD